MTTPIQVIFQQKCEESYHRDGVQEAQVDLGRTAGQRESIGAVLTRTRTTVQNGTGAATVITTAACHLYEVIIEASASAGFLQLYNQTAATVGVTAMNAAVPYAASETVTYRLYPGNSSNQWGTGLCAGTSTLIASSTAVGTAPISVTFVYT